MSYAIFLQTLPWLTSHPEVDGEISGQGTTFFIPDASINPQNQLETFGLIAGAKFFLSPAANLAPPINEPINLARTITRTYFNPSSRVNQIWFTPALSNWTYQAYLTVLRDSTPIKSKNSPQFYASSTEMPAKELILANVLKATT